MLRRELVTPIHAYTFRLVATAATFGVIGAAFALSTPAAKPEMPGLPTLAMPEPVSTSTSSSTSTSIASAASMPGIYLTFRAAGSTYLQIRAADPMPAHAAPTLHEASEATDWQTVAIADIAAIPEWRDAVVVVDGGCAARVTGFAVVARLTGETGYAPEEIEAWTGANVLELGAPVIAAKLDGCGAGTVTTKVAFAPVTDAGALLASARAQLLASPAAADAAREWRSNDRKGDWTRAETVVFETIAARDPITKTTWISVHARNDEGCGGPEINLWGLYRVEGAGLVAVQQRALGDLHAIKALVDLDGDGEPELVGSPWLGNDTLVTRVNGDELARNSIPFFGCGC